MASLTSRQRAHLRSLAHPLKAMLQIGKDGVTSGTIQSLTDALHTRELVKVKVLESAPDEVRDVGTALADGIDGGEVVQVIGRTIVFYRRHPEHPEIKLPD